MAAFATNATVAIGGVVADATILRAGLTILTRFTNAVHVALSGDWTGASFASSLTSIVRLFSRNTQFGLFARVGTKPRTVLLDSAPVEWCVVVVLTFTINERISNSG